MEDWMSTSSFVKFIKNNINRYRIIEVLYYEKPKTFNKRQYFEELDRTLQIISSVYVKILKNITNINYEVITVSRIKHGYKTKMKTLRSGRQIKVSKRNIEVDFPIYLFVLIPKVVSYEIYCIVFKLINNNIINR